MDVSACLLAGQMLKPIGRKALHQFGAVLGFLFCVSVTQRNIFVMFSTLLP